MEGGVAYSHIDMEQTIVDGEGTVACTYTWYTLKNMYVNNIR